WRYWWISSPFPARFVSGMKSFARRFASSSTAAPNTIRLSSDGRGIMTTKQKVGVGVGVFAAFALGFGSGAVAPSADAEPTKESKSFVADLRPEVRDLETQVEN